MICAVSQFTHNHLCLLFWRKSRHFTFPNVGQTEEISICRLWEGLEKEGNEGLAPAGHCFTTSDVLPSAAIGERSRLVASKTTMWHTQKPQWLDFNKLSESINMRESLIYRKQNSPADVWFPHSLPSTVGPQQLVFSHTLLRGISVIFNIIRRTMITMKKFENTEKLIF